MSIQDQVGPILNGLPTNLPDTDPGETAEWLESSTVAATVPATSC